MADYLKTLSSLTVLRKYAGLEDIHHYQHSEGNVLNPSISKLYDEDPKAAAKINYLMRQHRKNKKYLEHRRAVETYMRSVNPLPGEAYKYPLYGTVGESRFFEGDPVVKLPIDALRDKITFTVGDSFLALGDRAIHNREDNRPYPKKMFTYDELQLLKDSGELNNMLDTIQKYRDSKGFWGPAYVEAQIWEDPDILKELIKE